MKYLKFIFAVMLAAVMGFGATSCGDGDDEPSGLSSVTLADGCSTMIEADATESVVLGKVRFTAIGAWASEIYPTDENYNIIEGTEPVIKEPGVHKVNLAGWLEILPYAGNSGEFSPQVFFKPNQTDKPRYAIIKIVSFTNELVFKVCQNGVNGGGGGEGPIPNPGE